MDYFVLNKKILKLKSNFSKTQAIVKEFISLPFSGIGIVTSYNKNKECIKIYLNPEFYGIWCSKIWEETISNNIFIKVLNQLLQNSIICDIDFLYDANFRPDRIFYIKFIKKENFLNIESTYYLIAEFTGKFSNLILCDKNFTIINFLKKSDITINSNYILPYEIQNNVAKNENDILKYYKNKNIFKGIINFTKFLLNEWEYLTKTINPLDAYLQILECIKISNKIFVITKDNKIKCVSLLSFKHLQEQDNHCYNILEFDDIDTCYEQLYQNIFLPNSLNELKRNILSKLNEKLSSKMNIIQSLNNDLKKYRLYNKYKHWADIILANIKYLQEIGRSGLSNNKTNTESRNSIELYDWNENKSVEIPYNFLKSPVDNANELYKFYKKAKRGILEVEKRIENIKAEIKCIEDDIWYCQNAESYKDLEFILLEDIQNKKISKVNFEDNQIAYLQKEKSIKGKINKKLVQKVLRTKIIYAQNIKPVLNYNGCIYYVGKNSIQNDIITFTIAKSDDIWCHVQEATGGHVIIKKGSGEISNEEILIGASLAVLFSSAKYATKANVMVTKVSNIKKVPSGQPGSVLVSSYKTVVASPILAEKLLEKKA